MEGTIPAFREKGNCAYWADQSLWAEGGRIAAQIRITHLARRKVRSLDTEDFLNKALELEQYADGRMAFYIVSHPTWPWASLSKGIGKENFPKVVGLIEKFGRFYLPGHPRIPYYVSRPPETYYEEAREGEEPTETIMVGKKEVKLVAREGIWVAGIERLVTPSALWKYSGMDVDPLTGRAPKRARGKKLGFNMELRTMLYRLATSFIKIPDGVWRGLYERDREDIEAKAAQQGKKIIPTPAGRLCPECLVEVTGKGVRGTLKFCPTCDSKLVLKEEPPGVLYIGHVYQMALREMIKQWEVCLWLVWRQALGLPITQPYSVAHLGHKPIDPWEMVDRERSKVGENTE